MTANDTLLEGHENRLQACERAITAVTSHAEADSLRFQMISDQIEALGKGLTDSIENLGKRVDAIAIESTEHREYFKQLNDARTAAAKLAEEKAKKRRWLKRAILATIGALLTAVGEVLGEDAWKWLANLLKHKIFW